MRLAEIGVGLIEPAEGMRALDCLPDMVRRRRALEVGHAQRRQRVEDRVRDRREGGDRTRLAAPFHAERVGRPARRVVQPFQVGRAVDDLRIHEFVENEVAAKARMP